MILDKLKIELIKNPLNHDCNDGEHFCQKNLHHGGENWKYSSKENFHEKIRTHMVLLEPIINSPRWMNHLQGGTSSHTTQGKVLNTHGHLVTTNTQTPLVYPASMYGLDKALLCKGNTQKWTQPHRS